MRRSRLERGGEDGVLKSASAGGNETGLILEAEQ